MITIIIERAGKFICYKFAQLITDTSLQNK